MDAQDQALQFCSHPHAPVRSAAWRLFSRHSILIVGRRRSREGEGCRGFWRAEEGMEVPVAALGGGTGREKTVRFCNFK